MSHTCRMKLTNGKLAALLITLVIVIDQAVKIWVKTHFYYGEEVEVTSWFKLLFIENKTYGVCRITGKLIPKERLLAVPHATLSIEGKEIEARNKGKR